MSATIITQSLSLVKATVAGEDLPRMSLFGAVLAVLVCSYTWVYVCVCVCVCVCVYTYMYRDGERFYVCIYMCIYIYIYIYMDIWIYRYIDIDMVCVHTHQCDHYYTVHSLVKATAAGEDLPRMSLFGAVLAVLVCLYIYMCVCVCVCMYIYI